MTLPCLCRVAYQENKPTYLICPDFPTGILISSHFSYKPLTLLPNLVNSDLPTSVSVQKLLCPACTDVGTEARSLCRRHLESVLGVCFHQVSSAYCLRTIQISSYKFQMTWKHMIIWLLYTSLCLCKLSGCHWCQIQRTVFSDTVWPWAWQKLGGSSECWITETCACIMNQGWIVLWWIAVLFLFSVFMVVVPHPTGGSATWSFWVLSITFQTL